MGERLFDSDEANLVPYEAAMESLRDFDLLMEHRRQLEQEAQQEIEGGFLGTTIFNSDHPEHMDPLGSIELGLPGDTDEPMVF